MWDNTKLVYPVFLVMGWCGSGLCPSSR